MSGPGRAGQARQPEFSVDRDGIWRHRGQPIVRDGLLRLLVSRLCVESDGSYVLRAPGERVPIAVADAPLLVTEADHDASRTPPLLWLTTVTGSRCVVDGEHPLLVRTDPERGEVRVYHRREQGLEALVHRNVFYRLAELAQADPVTGRAGVSSDGRFFPLE